MPGGKVKAVKNKPRAVPEPVNSETGHLDAEDKFFFFFTACLTVDILSDPNVGNKSDSRSTSQLSFASVNELHISIMTCMTHWLNALVKKQSLLVPIPICIYSLVQPLLHPNIKTFYGSHKVAVEMEREAGDPTRDVIRIGNELFASDGYFAKKYGWHSFVGLHYLTKESTDGDYKPVTYTTQLNAATAQKPGKDNNKNVKFLQRTANPRTAGMLKVEGNRVVGQMRSNPGLTEQMCLYTHTLLLPMLRLDNVTVNTGALDSHYVPRLPKLTVIQRARAAYYMVVAGTPDSLMGICGITLHTSGPAISDTATLTCCKALAMLPNGAIPGDLILPPSQEAFQLLQLAHAMVADPSSCLIDMTKFGFVFQSVYSVCKAQLGATQVPQVMSEALTHARTTLMPLIEKASHETGYSLALYVLNQTSGIHGPFELQEDIFSQDSRDVTQAAVQDMFKTCAYLNRFCGSLSSTLSSAPLKSVDSTGGYLSCRTVAYIADDASDQQANPIYFVPDTKEEHTRIDSSLSPDAYDNIFKSFRVNDYDEDLKMHVLVITKNNAGGQLDSSDPDECKAMGFVDPKDPKQFVTHRVDPANLTRGVLTHVQGFNIADAKLLTQTYNVAFFVDSTCRTDVVFDADAKNVLKANGYCYLSDTGLSECDTIPRSSICNPNGNNRATINKAAESIQQFGGLGGFGDFLKTIGGGLASMIPVVGPAVSGIINSL